jgi:tetratricopeptide (TPR) repeat protein
VATPNLRLVALSAVLAFVLSAGPAAAADKWVEVRSEHFTVVSNDGVGSARNVAAAFERVRDAIKKGWPFAQFATRRPLLIVAVKNEKTMVALTPGFDTPGVTTPRALSVPLASVDRDYILVRADVKVQGANVNPSLPAYASYIGLMINSAADRTLPPWLTSGLSTVLGNSIVRDDELQFARPIPDFVRRVLHEPRLGLVDLVYLDAGSSAYKDPQQRLRLEAQSWAFVHYLMFHGEGAQGEAFSALVNRLLQRVPPAAAVRQTFGDLAALDRAYIDYLSENRFPFIRMPAKNDVSVARLPGRELDAPETAMLHASVATASGGAARALALLGDLQPGPVRDSAAFSEVEALAAQAAGDPERARGAWERAVARGTDSFYPYYAVASLTWKPGDPNSTVEAELLLRRAIALNETHAPSHLLLAALLLRTGRAEPALGAADRAMALDPDDSTNRIVRAQVLVQLSRHAEATQSARDAVALARTDAERRTALQVTDIVNAIARAPHAAPGASLDAERPVR